jgi:hypothetical protein
VKGILPPTSPSAQVLTLHKKKYSGVLLSKAERNLDSIYNVSDKCGPRLPSIFEFKAITDVSHA